jgi:hypothetical protein
MVVITPDELGVDETLALRVIATARTIAPIDTVTDSDLRAGVVAILTGVAQEAAGRGPRNVTAQRVGPASVNYSTSTSWFTDDDKAALRVLCAAGSSAASMGPVGSFPTPSAVLARVWPEKYPN